MNEARCALEADGLALRLPAHERNSIVSVLADDDPTDHVPLLDVAFADDGTVMLVMPAAMLGDALRRALVVISDVFATRGHLLNVGPTKTAAMPSLRGPGSKRAKRDIWHARGGFIQGNRISWGRFGHPLFETSYIWDRSSIQVV